MKRSKDKEPKPKSVKPNKIEPTPKNEAGAVSSSDPEKKEAGKSQGGVLVDLLTDTTSDHGNHIYHPHCQICLGKKPPPPSTSTKDDELVHLNPLIHVHVFCYGLLGVWEELASLRPSSQGWASRCHGVTVWLVGLGLLG